MNTLLRPQPPLPNAPLNSALNSPELVLQQGHSRRITAVEFAPGKSLVATAGLDGTARLWDFKSGQLLSVCRHGAPITHLAFARDGQTLVTYSATGRLCFWNVQTGRQIAGASISADNGMLNSAFACDGAVVTTFAYRGQTQTWDIATGAMKKPMIGMRVRCSAMDGR